MKYSNSKTSLDALLSIKYNDNRIDKKLRDKEIRFRLRRPHIEHIPANDSIYRSEQIRRSGL